MKTTIFFTVATLFSAAMAASDISDCQTDCLMKANDASKCNMDVQCACDSDVFQNTALDCVKSSCGASDQDATSHIDEYKSQFCS